LTAHGEVVTFYVGRRPIHMLTSPSAVNQLLTYDQETVERGPQMDRLRRIVGNGVLFSEGLFHRDQRRVMQPLFGRRAVEAHLEAVRKAVLDKIDQWRRLDAIDVDTAMNALALTAATRVLFRDERVLGAVAQVVRSQPAVSAGLNREFLLPAWYNRLPLPGNRSFRAAVASMDAAIGDIIATYRAGAGDGSDLLSRLLAAHAELDPAEADQRIRDEIMSIFFAGAETTGTMLGWFFHHLATRPELERQVHAEIDDVCGGAPIRVDQMPRLRLVNRVLSETMRLNSLAASLRHTRREVELCGYRLPPGSDLSYSPYAMHRDARWFPEPDRFDPDRWLPERADRLPKGAYIPFGGGMHKCIGDSLAMLELTTAVATIAAGARLQPVAGSRVRPVVRNVVHPDGLRMRLVDRAP
jgi:cytochrome P450